jgi:myo-inositol-1(or 4)-monophosphatase
LFFAEKGAGAWMNETRLRVSGRSKMIEALFSTGLPFAGRSDLPETLQDLARVLPACSGVRRFGSAALDLAYVAAGRYDGFWERRLQSWDMAAGLIIVREAGGLVEAIDPAEDILESGTVIAGNEPLFNTFSKLIRDA